MAAQMNMQTTLAAIAGSSATWPDKISQVAQIFSVSAAMAAQMLDPFVVSQREATGAARARGGPGSRGGRGRARGAGAGRGRRAATGAQVAAGQAAAPGRRGRTPRAAWNLAASQAAGQQKIQRAREQGKYIRIDDASGVESQGFLSLSGADGYFQTRPTLIYVPAFRLAGEDRNVRQVLANLGESQAAIDAAIAGAYTRQSLARADVRARFDQEVAGAAAGRQARPRRQPLITLGPQLTAVMQGLTNAQAAGQQVISQAPRAPRAPTAGAAAGGAAAGAGAGRGRTGPRTTLLSRLQGLQQGQVLDVSKLTAEGTGARVVVMPGQGSRKFGVPGLAIVSSDAAAYQRAVQQLGAGYEQFGQRYQAALAQAGQQQQFVQQQQMPVAQGMVGLQGLQQIGQGGATWQGLVQQTSQATGMSAAQAASALAPVYQAQSSSGQRAEGVAPGMGAFMPPAQFDTQNSGPLGGSSTARQGSRNGSRQGSPRGMAGLPMPTVQAGGLARLPTVQPISVQVGAGAPVAQGLPTVRPLGSPRR